MYNNLGSYEFEVVYVFEVAITKCWEWCEQYVTTRLGHSCGQQKLNFVCTVQFVLCTFQSIEF